MTDHDPQEGFAPLPDNLKPTRKPSASRSRQPRNPALYNLLTVLFLIAAAGACGLFFTIWNNPFTALNPFPPDTPFPVVVTETLTPTSTFTPTITRTPTRTLTVTPTVTLTPIADTATPAPSLTFTPVNLSELGLVLGTPGTSAPADPNQPAATAAPGFPFVLQNNGRVIYITNPEGRGGCAWSSITGTVIDFGGNAVVGYGVRIVGDGIDQTVATGSVPGAGAGGFELQLGTESREAAYRVQLVDPSGIPVSPEYTITTRADCAFNIAALRFVGTG